MENSIISNFRNELIFLKKREVFRFVIVETDPRLWYHRDKITYLSTPNFLFFLGEFGAQKLRSL